MISQLFFGHWPGIIMVFLLIVCAIVIIHLIRRIMDIKKQAKNVKYFFIDRKIIDYYGSAGNKIIEIISRSLKEIRGESGDIGAELSGMLKAKWIDKRGLAGEKEGHLSLSSCLDEVGHMIKNSMNEDGAAAVKKFKELNTKAIEALNIYERWAKILVFEKKIELINIFFDPYDSNKTIYGICRDCNDNFENRKLEIDMFIAAHTEKINTK